MINLTLTNLAEIRRRTVATVTAPKSLADEFQQECTFVAGTRKFRAVKTKSEGCKSVFKILMTMEGSESITGSLLNMPYDVEPLRWHRWTADNIEALGLQLGVTINGTTTYDSTILSLEVVETSPIHQRFKMRQKHNASGLIFEVWADIKHNDPVVDVWAKVVWSDRTDPAPQRTFEELFVRSGEAVIYDFNKKNGISEPVKVGDKWVASLGRNISFIDGSGLPLSGRMLTFLNSMTNLPGDAASHPDISLDLDSLQAAAQGPILGVCHDWDHYWIANKNLPRVSNIGSFSEELAWNVFKNNLSTVGTWYDARDIGIGKRPGATGNQEDFAATKGTFAVSFKKPRHIYCYQYAVYADMFRGFMFYEADGKPLDQANHPNWVTWNGVTHYHTGVSPDRLGKDPALAAPVSATTYYGYDDEHRSQNNLAAYLALTDDPLAMDIISFIVNTDLACYRYRYPTYGEGAARSQGRTTGCWANFLTLVPEASGLRSKILTLIAGKWQSMRNNPRFAADRAVPVLAFNAPDGRKTVYDSSGNLLPTWSIWEHALSAVGFYNAYKADPNSNNMVLLKRLLQVIAKWGCCQESDGSWTLIADMWYREGEPIPGVLSKNNDKLVYSNGGVGSWVLAALLVAAEVLPADDPLRTKASMCAAYYTNRQEGTTLFECEWWAAVQKTDI